MWQFYRKQLVTVAGLLVLNIQGVAVSGRKGKAEATAEPRVGRRSKCGNPESSHANADLVDNGVVHAARLRPHSF